MILNAKMKEELKMNSRGCIVIPCHLASKRFPGKALAKGYKTEDALLKQTYNLIKNNIKNYDLYVLTDTKDIIDYCEKNNLSYVISGKANNGTERLCSVLNKLDYEYYCIWQVDYPYFSDQDLYTIQIVLDDYKNLVTLNINELTTFYYKKEKEKPYKNDKNDVKCLMCLDKSRGNYISNFVRYNLMSQELDYIHIGIYIYGREVLFKYNFSTMIFEKEKNCFYNNWDSLEQKGFLRLGYLFRGIELTNAVSINTLEDLLK